MTVRAPPLSDTSGQSPPPQPIEPAILELLTAHRRPAAPPAAAAEPPRCHPERPDSPRERSICACEEACAGGIDREAMARRLLDWGADPKTTRAWLRSREPILLHYPYMDIDGLRIEFDGDGQATRCSHSSGMAPGSFVALECASLAPRGAPPTPARVPP
jgi:hypothetical protein